MYIHVHVVRRTLRERGRERGREEEGKRERGREGERERGRERGRESGREGGRERGREGKREGERKGEWERGREGERGRESGREGGREGERGRESGREGGREREEGREGEREGGREGGREREEGRVGEREGGRDTVHKSFSQAPEERLESLAGPSGDLVALCGAPALAALYGAEVGWAMGEKPPAAPEERGVLGTAGELTSKPIASDSPPSGMSSCVCVCVCVCVRCGGWSVGGGGVLGGRSEALISRGASKSESACKFLLLFPAPSAYKVISFGELFQCLSSETDWIHQHGNHVW